MQAESDHLQSWLSKRELHEDSNNYNKKSIIATMIKSNLYYPLLMNKSTGVRDKVWFGEVEFCIKKGFILYSDYVVIINMSTLQSERQ